MESMMFTFAKNELNLLNCMIMMMTLKKCYLCPRTFVTYLAGLYRGKTKGGSNT